jgi:hypothetical protein
MWPRSLYKRSLVAEGLEDLDEEGKYLSGSSGGEHQYERESVPLMAVRVEAEEEENEAASPNMENRVSPPLVLSAGVFGRSQSSQKLGEEAV